MFREPPPRSAAAANKLTPGTIARWVFDNLSQLSAQLYGHKESSPKIPLSSGPDVPSLPRPGCRQPRLPGCPVRLVPTPWLRGTNNERWVRPEGQLIDIRDPASVGP